MADTKVTTAKGRTKAKKAEPASDSSMLYRPYSQEELKATAKEWNVDPAYLEALYAVESSRGADKNAMGVRRVQRKNDYTFVRGPFQLEDDTVADFLRKNKMQDADISDPNVYLYVAGGIARNKLDQANGDYPGAFERYLGRGQDELGTTTGAYKNRGMREMAAIKARDADQPQVAMTDDASAPPTWGARSLEEMSPYMQSARATPTEEMVRGPEGRTSFAEEMLRSPTDNGSFAADDMFGIPPSLMAQGGGGLRNERPMIGSWSDFLADARMGSEMRPQYDNALGIPEEQVGPSGPMPPVNDDASGLPMDVANRIAGMVEERFKDMANA